ncbi:MarR family winged helix-turn-helix transcriptional regulator [Novosphingobium sp. TH158]|uniref:MarR family winged helix-turn-helix transcriptional regulator n=1 Tax=Novosphingobium sp. TH158 TaxID=2067455 RepID=UPI000C7C6890|nr:MarR family transcriptional regulator [Novosphingobium sp. TH158]PLK26725.1 MarR family transcriptional regulator [Novosphingobium sp. TH158]
MKKPVQPVEQLLAGEAFFSNLGLDVRHFGAIWHIFKIGQLMATDLNAISERSGISIADFHLLAALMMPGPAAMRATDLAHALNVTNAALSPRVRKLSQMGLLHATASTDDRRTRLLEITAAGRAKVKQVGVDLERSARFIRHFHRLPQADRDDLSRIGAELHTFMARDFDPAPRAD